MNRYLELPELPLIAILRGLKPESASEIGATLLEEGFSVLEVPMNRPKALECITVLAKEFGSAALIGAGTVLSTDDVLAVKDAGGKLIVAPDTNPEVIVTALKAGLFCLPGAATPTEAFTALRAGASGIKVFPADAVGPAGIRAWRTVLPADVPLFAVGGITPEGMEEYIRAGANGFGLGASLFDPEGNAGRLRLRASVFREAFREARKTGRR